MKVSLTHRMYIHNPGDCISPRQICGQDEKKAALRFAQASPESYDHNRLEGPISPRGAPNVRKSSHAAGVDTVFRGSARRDWTTTPRVTAAFTEQRPSCGMITVEDGISVGGWRGGQTPFRGGISSLRV